MIRRVGFRHNILSRRRLLLHAQKCEQAGGRGSAVSPLAPRSTAGKSMTTAAAATPPALDAARSPTTGRSRWRPSEAHKASATSVARKEAQSALRKAGVTAAADTDAAGKVRSPGLRRRELLGGAEDLPPLTQPAAAVAAAADAPASIFVAKAAGPGETSAPSVVSLSATTRFRARRELQRLAAAGNAEAAEALRALEEGLLASAASAAKRGAGVDTTGETGGSGTSGGGTSGGRGLTPLAVLPLLLAVVGAGYCAMNDLSTQELLSWIRSGGCGDGDGGGGSGGNGGGGDGAGLVDSARIGGLNTQREGGGGDSPLSPLRRTLSRLAAFAPVTHSNSSACTTPRVPDEDGSDVGLEKTAASSATAVGEGAGSGRAGFGLLAWRRHEREAAVEDGEDDGVSVGGGAGSDSGFVIAEPGGKG